jgi:8-oxo-dGTP pyrophosphatase MutT (NUDIX family)
VPPYVGTWAPPGGFVNPHESLEDATVREVAEEAGITLDPEILSPCSIMSLGELNQIVIAFGAHLERMVPLQHSLPESLDARWFSEEELRDVTLWEPSVGVDHARLFRTCRSGRWDFYQLNTRSLRRWTMTGEMEFLSKRNEPPRSESCTVHGCNFNKEEYTSY